MYCTLKSSLLFLYFVCISMYTTTSNARFLGIFMDKISYNASHKKLLLSTKVLESHVDPAVSVEEVWSSSSRSRDGIIFHEMRKDSEKRSEISGAGVGIGVGVGVSMMSKSKPFDSVAGRVRPSNNLDERTGLFSDYSRPRTRPPSHY